jgi:hypothetical protein
MRQQRIPAQGFVALNRGETNRRIVITLDDETFSAVRSRALEQRTSFAEQVRILVEWGLETVEEKA